MNVKKFTIARPARIRIAGGEVQFVHNNKVLDNSKMENTWHTFPAGTEFEVAGIMHRTQTILLQAKVTTVTKVEVEGKAPKDVKKSESFGIFIRGMSYDNLMDAAGEARVFENTDLEAAAEPAPIAIAS